MELNSIDFFGNNVTSFNIFPHQYDSIRYLQYIESQLMNPQSFKGAILADTMGLGKTRQIISLCEVCRVKFTLIICTKSTKFSWYEEALNTAKNCTIYTVQGKNYQFVTFGKDSKDFDVTNIPERSANYPLSMGSKGCIVIITHSELQTNIDLINKLEWDRICIDEAHILRNGEDLLIYNLCKLIKQPMINGNRIGSRFAITGTPISNAKADIVSLFNWIDDRYTINTDVILKNMIKNYLFRRNKNQIIRELKELMNYPSEEPIYYYKNIYLPETDLSRYIQNLTYDEMNNYFSDKNNVKLLESDERSFYIVYSNFIKNTVEPLQANSDLRVALSCPYIKLIPGLNVKFSGKYVSIKIKKIIEIIEKDKGDYVIFHRYKEIAIKLKENILNIFPQCEIFNIDGDVSSERRFTILKQIKELMKNGIQCILLSSIQSTSEGLNYQMFNKIMIIDQDWNPKTENQAIHRSYRIGQSKRVEIYILTFQDFQAGKLDGQPLMICIDNRISTVKSEKDPLSLIIEDENAAFFFKRLYLPINGRIQASSYFGDDFELREKGSENGPDSIGPEILETYPL